MLKLPTLVVVFVIATIGHSAAETNRLANGQEWITKPLALADCIGLALMQNSAVLKSKSDLEAAYGIVLQTRAIVLPKVRASGSYQINDEAAIDKFPISFPTTNGPAITITPGDQQWSAGIRVIQSVYEGGRIKSALRS